MHNVMRQIRRLVTRPAAGTLSDEELLDRFFTLREEDAFAALVRRHGPMVLGVCLRLLHHRQDAEDAFQASFLTLARKGHTIRQRGALASWLYRVAYRIALRLKVRADRKVVAEMLGDVPVDADPAVDAGWRELRPLLDQEIERLPAKYRLPMVLCYLEGKTYEEAASQIGCPKGTVAVRLLRARAMLKTRLVRRGLLAAAGCVMAQTVLPAASAAVPSALAASTIAAASALSAGTALAQAAPAAVAALVDAATRTFWVKKVQLVCAAALCLGLTGLGITGSAMLLGPGKSPNTPTNAEIVKAEAPPLEAAAADAAPPDVGLCIMEVDLRGGRPCSTSSAPPRDGQHLEIQHLGMAVGIAGKALNAAERDRKAQAFRLPCEEGRALVLLINPGRTAGRPRAAPGLALRGNLLDDAGTASAVETSAALPSAHACAAEDRAARLASRPWRAVIFTEQGRVCLFGGAVRFIFLTPACWVRAEPMTSTVFIF